MSKQSSIEWLVEQLKPAITLQEKHINEFLQQAKAMHRKEIEQAYIYGCAYQIDIKNGLSPIFYYNEIFGGQDNE